MSSNESEPMRDANPPERAPEQDEVPATTPDAPEQDVAEPRTEQVAERRARGRTLASGLWAGLIIAAVVLIFLLVFILQNLDAVEIHFLMFGGSVPIGVALLLAAVAGMLTVALPGVARMIQLRRHAKR